MSKFLESLQPSARLSRREATLGLPWLIRNGLASQFMETLAVGPFLIAYALSFGASNLTIGVLAAIPFLTQFVQLPAIVLVEKVRNRRLISFMFAAISRPMLLVMAMAVLMPSPKWALGLLIVALIGRYGLGAVVACSWNSWMRDLIPDAQMGRFFARRLMLMTMIGVVVSLAGAYFIDNFALWWPVHKNYAFPILLILGFIVGIYGVNCIRHIPEPSMGSSTAMGFGSRLLLPFRDGNFRRLILFLAPWNFAVNLAAPFFTVYLFSRLGFSLTGVILLMILSQVANMLVIQRWGAIADKFSNKSVLRVSAPLFICCIFAWTFTTFPEKHLLTVPLLILIHILSGIATAGVTLSTSNISLKLAPKGDGAAYLAVANLINALAAGIAPVIGGLTVDFFIDQELSLVLQWSDAAKDVAIQTLNLRHWDFFFLFATLIGLYSIHRLAFVEEAGEVEDKILIDEILGSTRQSVKNLSSIAGLRALTDFPLMMLRRRVRQQKHKRMTKGRN